MPVKVIKNSFLLKSAGRYFISGGINALVSIAAIFIFQVSTGNMYVANISGYLIGGISGFILHTRYTFQVPTTMLNGLIYYLIVLVGFTLNLIALKLCSPLVPVAAAQFISLAIFIAFSYTCQYYFLAKAR